MPVYAYQAIDAKTAVVNGTIAAETPRKARDILRAKHLVVQSIDVERRRKTRSSFVLRRRAKRSELANVIRELATLLSVGIQLVEALDTLVQQANRNLGTVILTLRDRVCGGAKLSEAAAEQPELFDELSIRMIEVGEAAGNLDAVLHRLADFQERALEFKDRIIGALLYPLIVMATSLLVTLFLMIVVMPMLLDQLIETGRPLPWPTLLLKFLSDSLIAEGVWIVIALTAVVIVLVGGVRTVRGQRMLSRFLFCLPVLGGMLTRQNLSRMAYVLATLLASGLDFVKAAQITSRGLRNPLYREALSQAGDLIQSGQEIGSALERTQLFPPMVVRIFTVGQASGQLEPMLERLAITYDRQVSSLANRIATVIEPVLILFLAVVIGFILFATILPILEAGHVA
jgi:general secretion pathway protein F